MEHSHRAHYLCSARSSPIATTLREWQSHVLNALRRLHSLPPIAPMTFPAWFDFHKDPVIRRHPIAMVLYAHMVSIPESFYVPQPLKAYVFAAENAFEKGNVLKAMNLLVERGYLIEHKKGVNGVRAFTVTTIRSTSKPNNTAQSA
jgi:hypothetical protein